MAATPEETIIKAAKAYMEGLEGPLRRQLHGAVRVHGSHRNDKWTDSEMAIKGLQNELARHARAARGAPSGPLIVEALGARIPTEYPRVDAEKADGPANQVGHKSGGMAWWTTRGDLTIDGTLIHDASWTVVLECLDEYPEEQDGPWQIVHSHFSIHHVPDGSHPPDEGDDQAAAETDAS
jgi:hypothetical protein